MISKALRGHDLGGLVRYLFGPGRAEEHSNQRIVGTSDPTWLGTTIPGAGELAQLIAELNDPMTRFGDTTKAGYVYHVVVSVGADDGALTDAQWQHTAQLLADKVGFDDQVHWIAVNHGRSSNGNDHIHFVANLMRDDGRAEKLPFDRLRRREACIALEEEFGLTATSPAGLGDDRSMSRREVESVRSGDVATVTDLAQHRVATIVRAVATGARSEPEFVERLRGEGLVVRARTAKGDRGTVTGYSVGVRSGVGGGVLWYGGGRFGKDLRLPALRARWAQTDAQRQAAAVAWFSDAAVRRRAEPRNLAAAADALRAAGARLEKVPAGDRFSWYVAATQSAGVLAAAASTTTDDRVRRELIKAWQAINRAVPTPTSVGVDVAPGDAAQLRTTAERATAEAGLGDVRPTAAWPQLPPAAPPAAARGGGQEISTLLGGVSRVLMAARLADAPDHARVQALLLQAVQLAAQIARTIAAQQQATAAQQRAAQAAERAAAVTAGVPRGGWQFARSGTDVLDAARADRTAGSAGVTATKATTPGLETAQDGPQPGR